MHSLEVRINSPILIGLRKEACGEKENVAEKTVKTEKTVKIEGLVMMTRTIYESKYYYSNILNWCRKKRNANVKQVRGLRTRSMKEDQEGLENN